MGPTGVVRRSPVPTPKRSWSSLTSATLPPLPKASSLHDHYEAITRGDTLVMALLNLWAAKTRPDLDLGLTWSER